MSIDQADVNSVVTDSSGGGRSGDEKVLKEPLASAVCSLGCWSEG